MPTVTEHDRLPYESARNSDDIARRVAQLEVMDAPGASRRKWAARFAAIAAIAWAVFFVLPYDPGYSSFLFMSFFGASLIAFALIAPKVLVQLILLPLAIGFGILLCLLPKQKKIHSKKDRTHGVD